MNSSWSIHKQVIIGGIAGVILMMFVGVFAYIKFFNKTATCFDGIQNQDERAPDCGGVCKRVCDFDTRLPVVYFERFYEAGPGSYNALALVENPNQSAFVRKARYVFKLYSKDKVLLTEKVGETIIPPGRIFPIFEHSLYTGERKATSVTFTFSSSLDWEEGDFLEPSLKVTTRGIENASTTPLLEAEVTSGEVKEVKNIQAIALVYDKSGNVMASSETFIQSIQPEGVKNIFFTWTKPFEKDFGKSEIVLRPTPSY